MSTIEEAREQAREALALSFEDTLVQVWHHKLDVPSAAHRLAGYSKGTRPITDEMVERAISAHRFTNAFGPEEVTRMRAALEAAEGARR